MKKGSWVTDGYHGLGVVKDVYPDYSTKEILLDIVLYDRCGNMIGRDSPDMGGPTDFEPACPAVLWREIKKPTFPLKSMYLNLEDLVDFIG